MLSCYFVPYILGDVESTRFRLVEMVRSKEMREEGESGCQRLSQVDDRLRSGSVFEVEVIVESDADLDDKTRMIPL